MNLEEVHLETGEGRAAKVVRMNNSQKKGRHPGEIYVGTKMYQYSFLCKALWRNQRALDFLDHMHETASPYYGNMSHVYQGAGRTLFHLDKLIFHQLIDRLIPHNSYSYLVIKA